MEALRVRAYNVFFGDALLISVPDQDEAGQKQTRHILIDVGNVLSGAGGEDDVFLPVINNVLEVLAGQPLDLYVMTHEHMDHVQGLPKAEQLGLLDLRQKLNTTHAWLTASAAEDYYDRFDKARKNEMALRDAFRQINAFAQAAASAGEIPANVSSMLWNNNPHSTAGCVSYLRQLAGHTHYVHRGTKLQSGTHHPFRTAKLEIWAPEEDTSSYYGRFRPMQLGAVIGGFEEDEEFEIELPQLTPPPGVDATAFFDLVYYRRSYSENLLAIDKARNNTSVVFSLEWRGWRLLFPGDAEVRSWRTMDRQGLLKPVHFLKIGHHGSHNGTPPRLILDEILPPQPADGRKRVALLSTHDGTYQGVPDQPTLSRLLARCDQLIDLRQAAAPGGFVDITFEA